MMKVIFCLIIGFATPNLALAENCNDLTCQESKFYSEFTPPKDWFNCLADEDCALINRLDWHCVNPYYSQPFEGVNKVAQSKFKSWLISHVDQLSSNFPTEALCSTYWNNSKDCENEAMQLIACLNGKCGFKKQLNKKCYNLKTDNH